MVHPPPLVAVMDVMAKEEEVKEEGNDATSETPPSSSVSPLLSSPTPLVARADIVTKVGAETANGEKKKKENCNT